MNRVQGIYDHSKQFEMFRELSGEDGKNLMYGVLYYFGVASGLRIGDILAVTVDQLPPLIDNPHGRVTTVLVVKEQKTGKTKEIQLDDEVLEILREYIDYKRLKHGDRLFPVSRQTALLHIKRAADRLGLDKIGTHSMRKTYG